MVLDKRICQQLRNAGPSQWDAFVQMFSAYKAEVTDAVTEADNNEILIAKGSAKQCKFLLRFFAEIDLP